MKTIVLVLSFIALGYNSIAQIKIAIVNNAEPKLYFEYVAFTIFGNNEGPIPCDFKIATYAERVLTSVLSKKYEVTSLTLPSELQNYKGGPLIKKWVKTLYGKFDKVILITNSDITDYEHDTNAILTGCGLYSRMGIRSEIYSTLHYRIYNTADGKSDYSECQVFKPVEGYIYSEVKNEFNPKMCDFVVREVKQFIKESIQCHMAPGSFFTDEEYFVLLECDSLKPTSQIESAYKQNVRDSILLTGWYYINDHGQGFKRKLDRSEETYYIDPMPIITRDNFSSIVTYETNFRGARSDYGGLEISLDDYGKKAFALATYNSLDRQIAFVINNKLVNAPLVKTIVIDAATHLRRGEYSLTDVQGFVKEINE